MAETSTGRIERELMDEPHIAGRGISVLRIYDLIKRGGDSPESVADTFGLADVYRALVYYYYDRPDEIEAIREARRQAFESIGRPASEPPTVPPV